MVSHMLWWDGAVFTDGAVLTDSMEVDHDELVGSRVELRVELGS